MPTVANNLIKRSYLRDEFVNYAERLINTPYIYGGDDPSGLDCSGLVLECGKAIGRFSESEDHTANGLYKMWRKNEVKTAYRGCLIFWFKKSKAVHVAIMKDNWLLIHAAGGGRLVETKKDAWAVNAYIKQRAFEKVAAFRKQRYGQDYKIVDPFLIKRE